MQIHDSHRSWLQRLIDRLIMIGHWLMVAFITLFLLLFLSEQRKLGAPGAPVQQFWALIASFALALVAISPPITNRLPGRWKGVPFVALMGVMFALGSVWADLDKAWERTPAGIAEAKENTVRDARLAEDDARAAALEQDRRNTEREFAEAASLQEQVKDRAEKLERCFTTFGHRLPKLEDPFRESLHNPDAFEHVETLAIVPDAEGNNVAMKFRGENGFGATRLSVVKATVDPETCDVTSKSTPEVL